MGTLSDNPHEIRDPTAEKQDNEREASAELREEHGTYLRGIKLVLFTITLMLGQFLTGIDGTVISMYNALLVELPNVLPITAVTAIPKITAEFHSLEDVGWYGSAYLLTTMALQPTFGKVYAYFDIKRTFVASVLMFEIGSIICAAAPSSKAFILGRAVAGVGQAAMLAGAMTVIGFRIPLDKRAIYFAILSIMNGVASVVGPPLGGIFTDSEKLTWRFCFWINVPLGAIVIIIGWFCFENPDQPPPNLKLKDKLAKMDLIGASLFITSMTCLFIALQRGGTQYPWSNVAAWGWLLGFALTLITFAALQVKLRDNASIPPRILCQRYIAACCIYICLVSIGFSAHTYYLPFYFQSAKGVSAENSGVHMIPYLASLMASGLVAGGLMMVVGYCIPFLWAGAVIFAVGSGLLTTLNVDSSTATWAGYQFLAGTGFGSTINIAAVAIQVGLPPEDLSTGNGLMLFSNFLGGALGVSIAQSLFSNVLEQRLGQLGPSVNPHAVLAAGATAIPSAVPAALVDGVREAYAYAISKTFILPAAGASVAFFMTFGVSWVNIKAPKPNSSTSKT
ncbi:hypothetical protein MMC13_001128 [Lambiella insularis]|nr:hypothetical protein [Lambiella insularis]